MGILEAILIGGFVVCAVIWLVRLVVVRPRPKPPRTLHGSTIDALTDPVNSTKPTAPEASGAGLDLHFPTSIDDLEERDR